jgi:hypothetical protein
MYCFQLLLSNSTCIARYILVGAASEREAVAYALDESSVTVPGIGANSSDVVKRARNVMAVVRRCRFALSNQR